MHTPSIVNRDSKLSSDSTQMTIARLGLRSGSGSGLGLVLGLGTRLPRAGNGKGIVSNVHFQHTCLVRIIYHIQLGVIVDGKEKVWTIPGVKAI
jgi:hypothetical protein